MTAIFVKSVRTATIAIFQFKIRGCIRFVAVAFRSEEEVLWRKGPSLTYLMHLLNVCSWNQCNRFGSMFSSCSWFPVVLYNTFSELQSPVIYPVCTPWNFIFKCISYAQTIKIAPTWLHLWADLAETPNHMCRAMISLSLPSLVNIHQLVL